jgi:uncharacterized OB-fold protein
MAKCSNCDYPYVPRLKPCPNCGAKKYAANSLKDRKFLNNYAAIVPLLLGIVGLENGIDVIDIIFLLIGIFYSYKRINMK